MDIECRHALRIALREASRSARIAAARIAMTGIELVAGRVALRMALSATGFTKTQVIPGDRRVRVAGAGAALARVEVCAPGAGTGVLSPARG